MTIIVDHKYDKDDFISFLKRRMLGYIALHIDVDKIKLFNEYFNSDAFKKSYGNIDVDALTILKMSLANLKVLHYSTYATISIDDECLYPNTNVRLTTLCKLMNYGNLSVDAYPIISDTFRHFSTHIKHYVNKYELGVG